MLIDWFTVLAQAVNFLILVYLLKRFLYKPILNAIDEREKRIASQLQEAAEQKAAAEEQHQKFAQLNEQLNTNKETLMADAQKEAEAAQQRLTEDARKEYNDLRSRLHDSLEKEQDNMAVDLKKRVQQETFEIARKALADLADVSLETQIIHVFIQKIKTMGAAEKTQLMAAFQPSSEPVTVRSTFDLTASQQADIENTIKNLLGTATKIDFQTAAEDVSGIAFSANGFKIAWSITEYLDSLEKRINVFPKNIKTNDPNPENLIHEN